MNSTSYEKEFGKCILVKGSRDAVVKYKNQSYVVNQIVLCIFHLFLTFLTTGLNGVAIFTINNSPSLKRILCYFLVMLQSWCDLITGLFSPLVFGFFFASEVLQVGACQVWFYGLALAAAPAGISFSMMVALCFERYMSIVYPIIHRNRLTQEHALKYLLANIVIYTITTLSTPFWTSIFFITTPFYRFFLLVIIGYFYIRIYQTSKKWFRKRRKNVGLVDTQNVQNNVTKNKTIRELMIRKKFAKTCFMTCVAYVLCYLPLVLIALATFVNGEISLPLLRQFQSWGHAISSMNPCLNSIIFFWSCSSTELLFDAKRKKLQTKCFHEKRVSFKKMMLAM